MGPIEKGGGMEKGVWHNDVINDEETGFHNLANEMTKAAAASDVLTPPSQ